MAYKAYVLSSEYRTLRLIFIVFTLSFFTFKLLTYPLQRF